MEDGGFKNINLAALHKYRSEWVLFGRSNPPIYVAYESRNRGSVELPYNLLVVSSKLHAIHSNLCRLNNLCTSCTVCKLHVRTRHSTVTNRVITHFSFNIFASLDTWYWPSTHHQLDPSATGAKSSVRGEGAHSQLVASSDKALWS